MDTAARNKLGILILAAALILGLLGDVLFRTQAWGANVPIFVTAVLACCAGLYVERILPISKGAMFLGLALFVLGGLFAWHASPELQAINGFAILAVSGLLLLRARHGTLSVAGLSDYLFKAPGYLLLPLVDFANLLGLDIDWKTMGGNTGAKKAVPVIRGVIIATPLLLVFGMLFVGADASFEKAVNRLFSFDATELPSDLLLIGSVAWLVGGGLRRIFLAPDPVPPTPPMRFGPDGKTMMPAPPSSPPTLGITEVGIVLGGMILLFAAFVATQFGHFFNTAQWVHDTNGVTFANYARRGFFELVGVAALALPTLVGMHSLLKAENAAHEKLFRILAWVLIGLLFVVIDSAAEKLRLYVGAYGLTTPRLYVCVSLAWISIVTVWFGLTALRGRTDRFAWGGVVAMLACVLATNVVNPDARVARVNTSRSDPDRVDWGYLWTLSDDAVPTLMAAWDRVPASRRGSVAEALSAHRPNGPADRDWRGWTLGRAAANEVLLANSARITAALPKQ